MNIKHLHDWDLSYDQARKLQTLLAERVRFEKLEKNTRLIAGLDCAFSKDKKRICAVIIVLTFPDFKVVETRHAVTDVTFPYIPGLLTFREGPVLMEVFNRLRKRPDLILFDGQGIAHPRRLGLASHMGLLFNTPSVGCAKSPLRVKFKPPKRERGSLSKMMYGHEQVGFVLRTRDGVNPLFISPGHMVDLPTSVKVVLDCGRGYRLPEPTRIAHIQVSQMRRRDEE